MRKAKVITTEISGRGNKIHQYGEIVHENQFASGNFDKLITGGYIKEEEPEPQAAQPDSNIDTGSQDEGTSQVKSEQASKKDKKENRFKSGFGKKT